MNLAKHMQYVRLAGAFYAGSPVVPKSAGKPDALQTLRALVSPRTIPWPFRHALLCLSLLVALALPAQAAVFISEFMAENTKTLRDEDGNYSDWIEIANNGPTSVNLAGYCLTDTAKDLTKWTFPSSNLSAGATLVVFASG